MAVVLFRTLHLRGLSAFLLVAVMVLVLPVLGATPRLVEPGAEEVEGARLKAFDSRWAQRIPGEDGWADSGVVEETLVSEQENGTKRWVRTQTVRRGKLVFINRTVFAAGTLRPIYFERKVGDEVPELILERLRAAGFALEYRIDFNGREYRKTVAQESGDPRVEDGVLSKMFYDGSVLGLVVATLPLVENYTARLPIVFVTPRDGSWSRKRFRGQWRDNSGLARRYRLGRSEVRRGDLGRGPRQGRRGLLGCPSPLAGATVCSQVSQ